MRLITLLTAALFLVPCLQAQTKTITSPPGYLTTEAGETGATTLYRMSRWFGGYSNATVQIIDDNLRGGGAKTLTQMDYRSDRRWHSRDNSLGRSWKNVTLSLARGNAGIGPLSKTFTLNNLSTAQQVFTGKMSWPFVKANKYSGLKPNDWGVVKFPFKAPHMISGKNSLVQNFTFTAGTLDQVGFVWGTSARSYLLDADFNAVANNGYTMVGSSDQCKDGYKNESGRARTYPQTYAATGIGGSRAGKIFVDIYIDRVAALRPTIFAFGHVAQNVIIPGPNCLNRNNFSVPVRLLLKPLVLIGVQSDLNGRADFDLNLPYNPAYVGVKVYLQGGWKDSVTGNLATTNSAWFAVLKQPPGKMITLYRDNSKGTTATVVGNRIGRLPLVRYTYK